jgi:hypothetical protein
MNNESLSQQLENLLKQHDWYYHMSDDHRVYKAGVEEEKQIRILMNQLGDEGKVLYNKYKPKIFEQVKKSDIKKVEEVVAKFFETKTKKYDDNPVLKGKQKTTLPDKLQAAIIKKKGGKVEESDLLFTNDFAKQNQVNYIDDEGRMAKQQLFKIKKYAQELCDMLDDNTQLEGWVQAKITKAEEAIGAVKHYMEYEMFRKQQG